MISTLPGCDVFLRYPPLALWQSKGDVEDIRREVYVMKLLGAHPHIARFHDAFEDSEVSSRAPKYS